MPAPWTRFRPLCRCALLLIAASLPAGGVALAADAPPRPNIVFILADDLDELTTPYWDAMPQTAARLRDRGVRFSHAFAPTPICCPARATLLTGKYGHNTGILTNGGEFGGWEAFAANGNEQRTLAVYLQQAGYRTALFGKYLNGIEDAPAHIPAGWSDWNAFVDNLSYTGYGYRMNRGGTFVEYGADADDYATDVLARQAVAVIEDAEADDAQPLFLYVAPTAPHLPLPPAPRHADHPYANAQAPRRPNYNEADLSDKSRWLRLSGARRAGIVRQSVDADHRDRMGSLFALDELVASIHDALAANGELANTYFVFASDNGYNLGAHRLIHKMAPYEESTRIPLTIAGPGIAPRAEARMALLTDLAPTFLDWAGAAIPADMDGKSLRPLLAGELIAGWRTEFPLRYLGGGGANGIGAELPLAVPVLIAAQDIPSYRALRTTRHTFVEWAPLRADGAFEYELYDLRRDPFQLDNLLATAEGEATHAALVQSLQARMAALLECSGAECP